MQLAQDAVPKNALRLQLGLAVLAVLGNSPVQAAPPTQESIAFDSAVLNYQESGNRINAVEGVVHLKINHENGSSLGINLGFDTLTGGSPNGALPSKTVQTFARPSGTSLVTTTTTTAPQTYTTASGRLVTTGGGVSSTGPYKVAPGALPMDPDYANKRASANLSWSYQLDPLTTHTAAAGYSYELDFQSMSLSNTVSRDFNDKNTTLTAGLNLEFDTVAPVGGAPIAMSDYALFEKEGRKTKQVQDLLLGVSQVINRRWMTQLNWSQEKASGYLNDPYKLISALDASGNAIGYVYEKRPADRTRNSLYWGNKVALDNDTVDFSMRYMSDDWGITSKTVDVRYRWTLPDHSFLEPQYRYYEQTAADFYRLYLLQGDPLVSYASADARLGAFSATTVGLKWGANPSRKSEISVRAQYYAQSPQTPNTGLAGLQGLDLNPGLRATMLQVGLKLEF